MKLNLFVCKCSLLTGMGVAGPAWAQIQQPPVAPGPNEPNWSDVLAGQWGLDMDRSLRNPVYRGIEPAGLFERADKNKPVTFKPIIALGQEATTRGGWYRPGEGDPSADRQELWSYTYKQPAEEMASGKFTPPPLKSGQVQFDPGNAPFGLWVANDNFKGEFVYSQASAVARANPRLRPQPYKAMIYPARDKTTQKLIANSFIIGWEYSTNDDFQDVVTLVENVRLRSPSPAVPGVVAVGAKVEKLAGGFKFTEGPAWNPADGALYFSDIPQAQIVRYKDGKASVANAESRQSNGLMVDKHGLLVRCEHAGRRVSAGPPEKPGEDLATHYQGKRLNSPNDLWIDAEGGIYFTDPRYGPRDDLEQDKEAVYYISHSGEVTRVVDDLVRPNGIALSPDGKTLYVVDNGADSLWRYPITSPGKVGKGERIADTTAPDGMCIDREGRLYVTCAGGVWVLDAKGKWLGIIETPEHPANCAFGGEGYKTLFITAQTSLYGVETQTRGWHVHLDGAPK